MYEIDSLYIIACGNDNVHDDEFGGHHHPGADDKLALSAYP
jgi:hypothetical protein